MEDLEGQEAIPTTESKIPLVDVKGHPATLEEMRDALVIGDYYIVPGCGPKPYLGNAHIVGQTLYADFPRDHDGKPATFCATLTEGFAHYAHGNSSSNETTEPPAKEKYSALKNFTDWLTEEQLSQKRYADSEHDTYMSAFAEGRSDLAADALLELADVKVEHDALYEACEKAHQFIESEDWHRDSAFHSVIETLAAVLTKAGKK